MNPLSLIKNSLFGRKPKIPATPLQTTSQNTGLTNSTGQSVVMPKINNAPFSGSMAPKPVVTTTPKPIVPTISTNPTTSGGLNINPATGGVVPSSTIPTGGTPVPTPTIPVAQNPLETTVSEAEKAYKANIASTPEEIAAEEELARLSESFNKSYQNTADQTIPLEFITGQQKSIENRALNLAEPLKDKLARLQAKRMSALETSKFALERADTALKTQREGVNGGKDLDTSIIDMGGKKVLVNNQTGAVIKEMGSTEASMNTENSMNQINLIEGALARSEALAGASGRSGIRKDIEGKFVGATDYTNLVAETNTLRTNILTLMTDPTIKKFFGPQMSNADVQLMTSAGTTLNPELQSPENMKLELGRLRELITRMKSAVNQGSTTTGSAGGGGLYDF